MWHILVIYATGGTFHLPHGIISFSRLIEDITEKRNLRTTIGGGKRTVSKKAAYSANGARIRARQLYVHCRLKHAASVESCEHHGEYRRDRLFSGLGSRLHAKS